MEGFRILVVEDKPAAIDQLAKLLREEFPTSKIDCAMSRSEATELLDRSIESEERYDLAIVDLMLPEKLAGSPAEYQATFSPAFVRRFWEDREWTAAFLMTAHSEDDKQIRAHFSAMDILEDERHRKFPKRQGYTYDILRASLACLHGEKILRLMRGAFGDERRPAIPMHSGLTTRLAEIRLEIQAHWKDLEETTKEQIRSRFEVNDSSDPIGVELR